MRAAISLITVSGSALVLMGALGGCHKMHQTDPAEAAKTLAQAKRQKAACASSAAYDRLKGLLFDQAIGQHKGDRTNLDTLADYTFVRMEEPVVKGWDPALDITHCGGRIVLDIPPGAGPAFAGDRHLQADINYTAQAAADGSGLVYKLSGTEPIVARLAAFNLATGAYRPPPAIDEAQLEPESPAPIQIERAAVEPPSRSTAQGPAAPAAAPSIGPPARRQTFASQQTIERAAPALPPAFVRDETGDATIRKFYEALGAGDGEVASAQVIPEKRSSRAFSPEAISRFYGHLPEPIRLTDITPAGRSAYRVSYRYSAGRSHCNGSAVVSVTKQDGRHLIRSIHALNGC